MVTDPNIGAHSKYRIDVHNPNNLVDKVNEMKREKDKKIDQAV